MKISETTAKINIETIIIMVQVGMLTLDPVGAITMDKIKARIIIAKATATIEASQITIVEEGAKCSVFSSYTSLLTISKNNFNAKIFIHVFFFVFLFSS